MGRKSHSQALSVWANGERVGTWTIQRAATWNLLTIRTG